MSRWLLALAAAALVATASASSGARFVEGTRYPVWSPNGKQIAYVGFAGQDREKIYIANREGRNVRRVGPSLPGIFELAWSPNGRWIAYTVPPARIEEISSDGSRRHRLTGCCAYQPDFSPGGRRIVYTNTASIYVIQHDGSDTTPVASRESQDEEFLAPTWSPDGRRIAFAVVPFESDALSDASSITPYLAVIGQNGGEPTKYAVGHWIISTDWSSDGRRILFVDDAYRIGVVDLKTGNVRFLGPQSEFDWARWSPNGREILFAHHGRIFVMNRNGSHKRRVLPPSRIRRAR